MKLLKNKLQFVIIARDIDHRDCFETLINK